MSNWTEVRYGRRRRRSRSPRGARPQHPPASYGWRCSPRRDRRSHTPPRTGRPYSPSRDGRPYSPRGDRRPYPPSRAWRPPSPRGPRRPIRRPEYSRGLSPPRERPSYPPFWERRPLSPSRDRRPDIRSWSRDRWMLEGAMDRALPPLHAYRRGSPLRRRRGPQTLNWPAPHPRAFQRDRPGIGTRTYADVARGPDLDRDGHEVKRLPADRELRLLIRELYAFIKAVHHLHNVSSVSGGTTPRTIARMVDTLSTMIKPAAQIGRASCRERV